MGISIQVEELSKSFGSPKSGGRDPRHSGRRGQRSARPVRYRQIGVPEIADGLLRPERGKIIVDGTNIIECSSKELYEIRTLLA